MQKVMVAMLNAIYEQDFLPCSYGFRPGRGHTTHWTKWDGSSARGPWDGSWRPTSLLLRHDCEGATHGDHRETDRRRQRPPPDSEMDSRRRHRRRSAPRHGNRDRTRADISPLLANIYLHYVLDEWFEHEVKPRLRGQAAEIRYADDSISAFSTARMRSGSWQCPTKRFAKYGLTLHPEKTRLLAFGRSAWTEAPPRAEARDLRFPRLHARLCAQPAGAVCDSRPDHPQTPSAQCEGGGASGASNIGTTRSRTRPWRSMPNSGATTSTTGGRRTTAVCGSSIGSSGGSGTSGSLGDTRGKPLTWRDFAHPVDLHPLLRPRICHAWASPGSPA